MAISSTHNVTAQDVLDELPVDDSRITATSDGLNTVKIDGWIDTASGVLNALLTKAGIDPTALGDDETELIRSGIIAYAAGRSAIALALDVDIRTDYFDTWRDIKTTIKKNPQALGASMDAADVIVSNVDPTDATTKNWSSDDFGGW